MRALAPVVLFLLFLPVQPLFACSICGCDPAAGTLGLDRPSPETLRVALEDRFLWKESGAGPAAEGEREDRLQLRLQATPLSRLSVGLELPFYLWRAHRDATGFQDDVGHGLGDVAVRARYELLRLGGFTPRHVLSLLAGLKAPTGANDRHLPGAGPDEHLQLGTGSWDTDAGLSWVTGEFPWSVFATATARLNGTNGRGFRYGHALFASLGARRVFLDSRRLLLQLEGQARVAGRDRAADGSFDPDSGGQVYYATASAAWALTMDLLLRASVQAPVATALHGAQTEHPVAYLALGYDVPL